VTVGYALEDPDISNGLLHHWKSEGNGYRQWQKLYPQDIEQLVSSIDDNKGHCLALGHTHSSTEEMIVAWRQIYAMR